MEINSISTDGCSACYNSGIVCQPMPQPMPQPRWTCSRRTSGRVQIAHGLITFLAIHKQDWQPYPIDAQFAESGDHTHTEAPIYQSFSDP